MALLTPGERQQQKVKSVVGPALDGADVAGGALRAVDAALVDGRAASAGVFGRAAVGEHKVLGEAQMIVQRAELRVDAVLIVTAGPGAARGVAGQAVLAGKGAEQDRAAVVGAVIRQQGIEPDFIDYIGTRYKKVK